MDEATREQIRQRIEQAFSFGVPHNKALGLRTLEWKKGEIVLALPWREDLVGNPETGVLHGGAVSSLLDAASGASVFLAMQQIRRVATLDLRIDYLRPGIGERFGLQAEVLRLGSRVASTRMAFLGADGKLLATGAGAYIVS